MTLPADRKIPYRAILFWGQHSQGDYYKEVAPFREPKDYVRNDVPRFRRECVAEFLDSGEQILGYMGYADCRICGDTLGTRDMGRDGLVWPEMASHYIRKHQVWTPEHQELWCKLTWKINL